MTARTSRGCEAFHAALHVLNQAVAETACVADDGVVEQVAVELHDDLVNQLLAMGAAMLGVSLAVLGEPPVDQAPG